MTTDQTKALEILLEIGGDLDYETQFAPLLRFVLSGSVEKKEEGGKKPKTSIACPSCCEKNGLDYMEPPAAFSGYTRICVFCKKTF